MDAQDQAQHPGPQQQMQQMPPPLGADFARARDAFLRECCVGDDYLAMLRETARFSGLMCVHINTRGEANVLVGGARPVLKHVFLQNPRFRNEIVEYYRAKGFGWVDVTPINRVDWKIFLSPPENRRAPQHVTPFQFQMQPPRAAEMV
jgi:hypothetical protein